MQLYSQRMDTTSSPLHARTTVRKCDKLNVEIILHARQYFEDECFRGQSFNFNGMADRAPAKPAVSANIVDKIRTEEDLKNWAYESGQFIASLHKAQVPNHLHC